LQVEWFWQVLVGAALRGPDRRHEGVLRAHDDDRQVRPHLLDARQQVERAFVGHDDVSDDKVALALADPAPQGCGVAGEAHLVAGARQGLIENSAYRRVVVGDQDATDGHYWCSSSFSV